jgi:hypothetical protein
MKSGSKENNQKFGADLPELQKASNAMLADIFSIDGSHWSLELHPFEYRRSKNPCLESLTGSDGAQNPFFDPAFVAASRDRMTRMPLYQLVVWENLVTEKFPRLSIPLTDNTHALALPEHFASLSHEFAPIGNPLFHGDDETIVRFCQLLAIAFRGGLPPLKLDHLTSWSPFASMVTKVAESNGLFTTSISTGNRAAVFAITGPGQKPRLSSKRKREMNRLQNKLAESGNLEFELVTEPFDILLRLEEFLLMEAKGWKGRKGTSIHALKRNAAFARQSVFDMAKEGKASIYSLRLDGRGISSLVVFHSAGCYYPWKTAFLEVFRHFSPGKLLMHRFLESIETRQEFRHVDSLARVGTSWMSHLAPDDVETSMLILAGEQQQADKLADHFRRKDDFKTMLKRLLLRR